MAKSTTKERKAVAVAEPAKPAPFAHSIAAILGLILVTAVVYGRCAGFDYVHWDDQLHVYQNPYLAAFNAENLKRFWAKPYEGLYIPLSYTVYALIARSARMTHFDPAVTSVQTTINPHPFHAVNILVHTLNVLLVFAILRKLVSSRTTVDTVVPALIGALLFSIHPFQVESVAWISELRGLLCGFFSLAAILAYTYATTDVQSTIPLARWTYWASILLFAFAGLCKPSSAALPLALIAIDHWAGGRRWRSAILSAVPFVLISAYFIYKTHGAQPVPDRIQVPLWTHPFVAADALAFYLSKLLVPYGLTIDYGRKPGLIAGNWWGFATWIVPAAIAFAFYRLRKSAPLLVTAGAIMVSMLLPVLGLVAFVYQDYSTVADRYMYLAMLGPALAAATALSMVPTPRAVNVYAVASVIVAMFAAVTVVQVGRWKNSFALFEYAVSVNPNGYQMRENYGVALKEAGKLDEAVEQFNKAIEIEPGYSRLYNDLGLVDFQKNDMNGAIQNFQLCVDREPGFADGHRDLGTALLQTGQVDRALVELKLAVDAEPLEATCHNDYANALLDAGRGQEAADEYHKALAIDPTMPEALFGLAEALVTAKDYTAAETAARQAIAIEPTVARAHGALARALDAENRLEDAVAEYRQAISLDPKDALMHYNLACAYFNRGDNKDAIPELQQAASISSNPSYYDALGMACGLAGDRVNAKAAYEEELSLNPNSDSAKQALAKLGG